jgi:hypothetical protein
MQDEQGNNQTFFNGISVQLLDGVSEGGAEVMWEENKRCVVWQGGRAHAADTSMPRTAIFTSHRAVGQSSTHTPCDENLSNATLTLRLGAHGRTPYESYSCPFLARTGSFRM